jgi:hypothetical protein
MQDRWDEDQHLALQARRRQEFHHQQMLIQEARRHLL